MRDGQGRGIFPYLMQAKGVDHDLVNAELNLVKSDIVRLGYRRITIKSDNEPSLLAFLRALRRHLGVEMVEASPETSCEYDPSSNGSAECGVGVAKGMINTACSALEERLGVNIPDNHPLHTWLCQYGGAMQRRYTVGDDGRTAFERVHGRKCS